MTRSTLALLLLFAAPAAAQTALPPTSAAAIADADRLLARVQEEVWPGWGAAPSQLLLVTDSLEYFRPDLTAGPALWTRPRIFFAGFLATFPAVNGVSTIVIGTPERTGLPRDRWTLTVLHEHFHQLQHSRPGYFAGLNALGLARGDTTGMWALNYAFPYDSAPIRQAFDRWVAEMKSALEGPPPERAGGGARARVLKEALDRLLSEDDRKYLDFQLWQEGVPRWIELEVARRGYQAGLVPIETLRWQEARLVNALGRVDLARDRREVVYPVGAAMAELLNWEGEGWKREYFESMFTLDR
jgi:hypothetical protein